jgi:hypothetical protein
MTYVFKNEKLQVLYNTLNSQEGYNLRGIKQIHDVIYPLLSEVIHEDSAYSEAIFNWPNFQCVVDVVENSDKEYTCLSEEESMCYSLWWNTNYSHFQNYDQDPELEAIFPDSKFENPYADSTILQQVHNHIINTNHDADYLLI